MKTTMAKTAYKGRIPKFGETFKVRKSNVIYIRVNPVSKEGMVFNIEDKHIVGVSLESGRIHTLPIDTKNRHGFILVQPVDGAAEFENVPRS